MTASSARVNYGRALRDSVTLKRLTGTGANQTAIIAEDVRAKIMTYAPQEISGRILAGDLKVLVLAQDLDDANWPAPPRTGDKLIGGGKLYTVQDCDASSRKVDQTVIAYEVQVRG